MLKIGHKALSRVLNLLPRIGRHSHLLNAMDDHEARVFTASQRALFILCAQSNEQTVRSTQATDSDGIIHEL
jgi:hypothetical protein